MTKFTALQQSCTATLTYTPAKLLRSLFVLRVALFPFFHLGCVAL